MKAEIFKHKDINDHNVACIITDLAELNNGGFTMTFRYYNITLGCGGYQKTIWVSGAPICLAKMFCGTQSEMKNAEIISGGKVFSKKTNNKVSEKFSFSSMEKKLK